MELEDLLQAIMLSGGSPFMGAANLGRELGMGLGRSQETPAEEYPRIETMTPTSSPPSVFTGNQTTPAPSPAMTFEDQEPQQDTITDEQIAEMLQSGMFVMRGNRAGTEEEIAAAQPRRDDRGNYEGGYSRAGAVAPGLGFVDPTIRKMNEALKFVRAKSANEQAGKYDAEKLSGRVSDVDKKGAYNLLNTQINANLIADPQLIEKLRAAVAAGNLSEQDFAALLGGAGSDGQPQAAQEDEGGGLGMEEALMTAAGLAALYFGGKKAKGLFKKKGAAATTKAAKANKQLGLPQSTVPPVADVVNAAGGVSKAPLQLEDLVGKLVSKSKGASAYPLLTPDQQRLYAQAALKKLTRNSGQVLDRSASKDEIMRRLHEGLLRGNADIAQESALETALRSLSKR